MAQKQQHTATAAAAAGAAHEDAPSDLPAASLALGLHADPCDPWVCHPILGHLLAEPDKPFTVSQAATAIARTAGRQAAEPAGACREGDGGPAVQGEVPAGPAPLAAAAGMGIASAAPSVAAAAAAAWGSPIAPMASLAAAVGMAPATGAESIHLATAVWGAPGVDCAAWAPGRVALVPPQAPTTWRARHTAVQPSEKCPSILPAAGRPLPQHAVRAPGAPCLGVPLAANLGNPSVDVFVLLMGWAASVADVHALACTCR